MRRTLALSLLGLVTAASLLPVQPASAVCGPDLSSVGGPSCPNLCPGVVTRVVNKVMGDGFLSCLH